MHEVASKAATEESTAGLLKVDDIASTRAVTPSRIASGGGGRTAPLAGKPRGFFTALFAGGLGLAILAGRVTCPTCDPVHAGGQLDAEQRISSPLSYAGDLPAALEAAPLAQADPPVAGDRAEPPAISALALAKPGDNTATTSTTTAAISPAPDRVPGSVPAPAAAETTTDAGKLPATIEQLPNKGPPQADIAAATAESEPKTPVPPVGDTTLPSKNITGVEPEEPTLRASAPHKDGSVKQRRAKARIPANKYSQTPAWAAKMFETNWQDKAFAYQYETHSLPSS
jgi:hypothetical protein